ncbi:MAG: 4Fe-4S binding protein, partial [Lachnospiraceae bacterium]|nr:4Fe-4S binding protein [Lachnospiraceae bacterium]
ETENAKKLKCASSKSQEWGYDNMPIGGINPRFGSTVIADLSPSRQGYIPLFIKERCINCGLCFSACPDMVFQFEKGEYKGREMMVNKGLDYYHCKGCLRCVDVCPVNALVRGLEAEHPNKDYFIPNQELIRKPDYYEESGPDGYITSESYLTEQRMEGGEI